MNGAKPGRITDRRKWRVYVHPFQRRYAIWVGLLIFVTTLLVYGVAFLSHYAAPVSKLAHPATLEERRVASQQFIALAETGGPALVILIFGAALLSLYLTHRLAGPLYRLEQSARELVQGNLSLRIKFRSGDELHGLAGTANEAIHTIEKAFVEIRAYQANSAAALHRAHELLQRGGEGDEALKAEIRAALKEGEGIESVVKRFRLSDPS